jgi:hypothetical protein
MRNQMFISRIGKTSERLGIATTSSLSQIRKTPELPANISMK